MTLAEALKHYSSVLKQAGVDESLEETRVLACHILETTPALLFSEPERLLSSHEASLLESVVLRRAGREPSAYITGHREFYGLDMLVDRRVLIPRPETELLVEQAIRFAHRREGFSDRKMLIADVGTGSGAIAIALALNMPAATVCAVDISAEALQVAALNVERHGLSERVKLIRGNLLDNVEGRLDLVAANLPYIPACVLKTLQPEVALYEPVLALDGGTTGLDLIDGLLMQLSSMLNPGGAAFIEFGQGQQEEVMRLVTRWLPKAPVGIVKDMAGIARVLQAEIIRRED